MTLLLLNQKSWNSNSNLPKQQIQSHTRSSLHLPTFTKSHQTSISKTHRDTTAFITAGSLLPQAAACLADAWSQASGAPLLDK